MPYTGMYVGAIQLGFTTADLATMPLNRLLWFIHAHNNNQKAPSSAPKAREGTIAELKRIL